MALKLDRSRSLYDDARALMPAGVNSPVRAFGAVGGTPIFYASASGSRFTDPDGNTYVDYCGSWGPLVLGHAHPRVVEAVREAAARGLSYGAPHEREIELARLVTGAVPAVEMVRFVNSGTEAAMSAVRLARGATGRDLVVKFEGCYHGHADHLLVKGGSGLATFGTPSSAGVPETMTRATIVLPLDDEEAIARLFRERGPEIAAVILEPVPANAGLLRQRPDFLRHLRTVTREAGALLIFDEVITGFRLGSAGASGLYGITPDLMVFGKVIGSGMPIGAFGGRKELMEKLAPLGPVYQAGTLSGNPVAMAAGVAGLREVLRPGFFAELEAKGARLETGVEAILRRRPCPVTFVREGSIFWFALQAPPAPRAYHEIDPTGAGRYARFHRALLERGVYLAPSGYEVGFISAAHSEDDLAMTLRAIEEALVVTHRSEAADRAAER